jgi:hypothetical protein
MTTQYETSTLVLAGINNGYGTRWLGMPFLPVSLHTITAIRLPLYRVGSPGTVTVSIRATAGGLPTGSDLTSGTTAGNSLSTSYPADNTYTEISVTPYQIASPGQLLEVIVRATSGDASNYVNWCKASGSPYVWSTAQYSSDSGANWSATTGDMAFAIMGGDTAIPVYRVWVDWDNDGDWTESDVDISSSVKEVRFGRGRDSELGRAVTGFCSVRLNNSTGTLHASVLPKRPVKVIAGATPLFTGFIEEITPHPDPDRKDCYLSAVDGRDYLTRAKAFTWVTAVDVTTNSILTNITSNCAWGGGTNSDSFTETIHACSIEGLSVVDTFNGLLDALGAFWYIGGDGKLNMENASHRSGHSAVATLTNIKSIAYALGAKSVFNVIEVPYQTWDTQTAAALYTATGLHYSCAASSDLVLEFTLSEIYGQTVTLTTNVWKKESDNSVVTSLSASEYGGGHRYRLTFTNPNAFGVYLDSITIQAPYYTPGIAGTVVSSDATSKAAYQERTQSISSPFIQTYARALALAPARLAILKDPSPEISVTIVNKNATLDGYLNSWEISDKVHVHHTDLGLDGDYFIDYMEHEISDGGKKHVGTYRLVSQ